jgi:hypothetical protein
MQENRNIETAFGNVAKFKYLEMTVTNHNHVYEEINRFSSSHLLSKNVRTKRKTNYNFIHFFSGCETWFLTPRYEHRLRMFGNIVLGRIFDQRR